MAKSLSRVRWSAQGAVLKGVPLGHGIAPLAELLRHLKHGSLASFDVARCGARHRSGRAARRSSRRGTAQSGLRHQLARQLTPLGMVPSLFHFRVAGIFESGLYDLDSPWAFTTLPAAQRVLDLNDVVNSIELRLDDIFEARDGGARKPNASGPKLVAKPGWIRTTRC